MKALVVAKKPAGLYFVKNNEGKFDLLKPQKMLNGLDVLEQTDLCKTQRNEVVKTYLLEEAPTFMERWDGSCLRLTSDAFWSLQVYGIKAILVGIHQSFDSAHAAEANYTRKLIGLLEGVFHQFGGIHAKGN